MVWDCSKFEHGSKELLQAFQPLNDEGCRFLLTGISNYSTHGVLKKLVARD